LPPSHPLVKAQGFDPIFVNKSLTADAADVVKAGYNLRGKFPLPSSLFSDSQRMQSSNSGKFHLPVLLMGPEQPISKLSDQLKGINWDGTGVGFGVRGSPLQNLTVRLEGRI